MNVGDKIAIAQILLGLGSAIGYFFAGDCRRALYFFLGSCITATVTYHAS